MIIHFIVEKILKKFGLTNFHPGGFRMIKKYMMGLFTFVLALGVLVGCNGIGDDQDFNNDNLRDVNNPGLNDVNPRDVDYNGNDNDNGLFDVNDNNDNDNGLFDNDVNNNVGDENEPDLDEEPSEQRNDNFNNNDLNNNTNDLRRDMNRNNR